MGKRTARRALDGSAADRPGLLPDNLRVVAADLAGLAAVRPAVPVLLLRVEETKRGVDDRAGRGGAEVLTVVATLNDKSGAIGQGRKDEAHVRVVGVLASLGVGEGLPGGGGVYAGVSKVARAEVEEHEKRQKERGKSRRNEGQPTLKRGPKWRSSS